MLVDEGPRALHLDTLEHARAPMQRDADELALLARMAPVPAGPLRRWRLHAAGAGLDRRRPRTAEAAKPEQTSTKRCAKAILSLKLLHQCALP